MTWLQIIGLIGAILLGIYNAAKGFRDETAIKALESQKQSVESVYDVGEPPVPSPPPTDPGH